MWRVTTKLLRTNGMLRVLLPVGGRFCVKEQFSFNVNKRRCQSSPATASSSSRSSNMDRSKGDRGSKTTVTSNDSSNQSSNENAQFSHITRDLVWGLWNDGNLFSLSTPELSYFLRELCNIATVDARSKKSALVRQVEEILSAEQAKTTVPQEDTSHTVVVTDYDRIDEALDEADEYGDWGAEPGFETKRKVDYMEINPQKLTERFDPLAPRAYQLLHSDVASDVKLSKADVSKLPGQSNNSKGFVVRCVDANDSNKVRFNRAFKWCVANAWNMNIPAELNIGAGKVLFYRHIAKQNKNILPKWTLQRHSYTHHPYVWFAIASESNVVAMETLAEKMNMKLIQDATTSYKLSIRRMGEIFDGELNAQLQCTKLNKPWDRFFVSHYVRSTMPDLRFLVRGRHPIKKRVADAYLEADVLRSTRDSVQSVLSPELGDVIYCCERVIRKWATRTESGGNLQLVETRRTPLIINRVGDEGERLEYEWIVPIPQRAERIDISKLSDELWDYGNTLAVSLEEGMEELMAHVMTTSAAY